MTDDSLAPRTMPGGDTVCTHCDSGGNPRFCDYHSPYSPSVGLFQIIPGRWETP